MDGTLLQGSGMRHEGICLNMEKHKQECRSVCLYVHQCLCACPRYACVLIVLVIRGLVTGLLWQ